MATPWPPNLSGFPFDPTTIPSKQLELTDQELRDPEEARDLEALRLPVPGLWEILLQAFLPAGPPAHTHW